MARVTSSGQQTAEAIRKQAAASFAAKGYEATSLRQVAADVGIKVGSLYNHITSKQELLFSVMGGTMDELNADMAEALENKEAPLDQLIAFVGCHIRFHAEHAQQVFIGNSELRSLDEAARKQITEARRKYREQLESLILDVADAGLSDLVDVRMHTFNIVAIGAHIAGWYRVDGDFSLSEIVQTYTKIILRSMNVVNADQLVDEAMLGAAA